MYLGCVVQWFHCLGVFWVFLHIYRLIGFRNRILVFVNWAWDYLFYENQIRWITRIKADQVRRLPAAGAL